MAKKNKRDPLPESFRTIEEAAEFWDAHSLADYWEYTTPVKFDVKLPKEPRRYYPIEESLARRISKIAERKKISPEILVNLWIQERVLRYQTARTKQGA